MAPVNKPKHKGKALVAGAAAGILGEIKYKSYAQDNLVGYKIQFYWCTFVLTSSPTDHCFVLITTYELSWQPYHLLKNHSQFHPYHSKMNSS